MTKVTAGSIQVVDVQDEAPSSITYPDAPFTFIKNTPVTGVLPTNVGGVSSDWTIDTGSLPSGLSLDFLTGEISGTPDTGDIYLLHQLVDQRHNALVIMVKYTIQINQVVDEAPSLLIQMHRSPSSRIHQ